MDESNPEHMPGEENQSSEPVQEPAGAEIPVSSPGEIASEMRTLGMLCHLLGIFTSFVGPLILWVIKKDESEFVEDQGREALNFQLTMLIGWAISFVSSFFCIGFLLAPAIWLVTIIFGIIACVEANKGVRYRYPICLRMVTQ